LTKASKEVYFPRRRCFPAWEIVLKQESIIMKNHSVLVLNSNWQPFDIWGWQRAMVKLLKGNVYMAEKYDWTIRDGKGQEYDVPCVLVLKKYINAHNKPAPYGKRNIAARDGYTCQYCGEMFPSRELTIDHVIPRSKWKKLGSGGSPNKMTNAVASCETCNRKKGDRTPKEANMMLLSEPKNILQSKAFVLKFIHTKIPQEWLDYITIEGKKHIDGKKKKA
jgi:hypothetical protein